MELPSWRVAHDEIRAPQQEAVGYALQANSRAALAKFDKAHELASQPDVNNPGGALDTSYCTPAYIEIQRAKCWIDLGKPRQAVHLLQDELAALPQIYRNDRSLYLARLAHAYARAGEPEKSSETATKALAIVAQTGSSRTLAELSMTARVVEARQDLPTAATFTQRLQIVRDQLTNQLDQKW